MQRNTQCTQTISTVSVCQHLLGIIDLYIGGEGCHGSSGCYGNTSVLLTRMTLSVSVVTSRPRPSSIAMYDILNGSVTKLANGFRLYRDRVYNLWVAMTTHSSVDTSAWQSSHIRTGISKPIGGNVDSLTEHVAHTARPQRRQ